MESNQKTRKKLRISSQRWRLVPSFFQAARNNGQHKGVVAGFDADDEAGVGFAKVAQMGSVGGQGVLDDDDGQVRMFLAKRFQPAAGGVAFAVVFGVAVRLDDRFGRQRDDFLVVGMDQDGAQHLVGITDAAVAMVFHQTRGAMDFGGGEIAGAVERHQVMAIQIDEVF